MAVNARYVGTAPGLVKLLHIVFGVIAIGCGGHSYESEYPLERIFLWTTVTFFIISFIYLLIHLASDGVPRSTANKGIDMLYHVLAGIFLIVAGSLMIASVKKYDKAHCQYNPWELNCQPRKKAKLAGGSFSIINGIFYLICVVLIAVQKYDDPDMQWETRGRGYPSMQTKTTEPTATTRLTTTTTTTTSHHDTEEDQH